MPATTTRPTRPTRPTRRTPGKTRSKARAARSKAVAPLKAPSKASLRCPECGFKAKHAMGLGRHRSSRHGIASIRSQTRRARLTEAKFTSREAALLDRRMKALEARYDRLSAGLFDAARKARP